MKRRRIVQFSLSHPLRRGPVFWVNRMIIILNRIWSIHLGSISGEVCHCWYQFWNGASKREKKKSISSWGPSPLAKKRYSKLCTMSSMLTWSNQLAQAGEKLLTNIAREAEAAIQGQAQDTVYRNTKRPCGDQWRRKASNSATNEVHYSDNWQGKRGAMGWTSSGCTWQWVPGEACCWPGSWPRPRYYPTTY